MKRIQTPWPNGVTSRCKFPMKCMQDFHACRTCIHVHAWCACLQDLHVQDLQHACKSCMCTGLACMQDLHVCRTCISAWLVCTWLASCCLHRVKWVWQWEPEIAFFGNLHHSELASLFGQCKSVCKFKIYFKTCNCLWLIHLACRALHLIFTIFFSLFVDG